MERTADRQSSKQGPRLRGEQRARSQSGDLGTNCSPSIAQSGHPDLISVGHWASVSPSENGRRKLIPL